MYRWRDKKKGREQNKGTEKQSKVQIKMKRLERANMQQ